MLFYHFDMLDDFINHNLVNNLKTEEKSIEQIITLYENKKSNLLSITTNMVEVTESMNKKNLEDFYETFSSLKKLFEDINIIQELASHLKKDLNETISLYHISVENNKNEIKANLVEYNKQRDELLNKILKFENINTTILDSAIKLCLNNSHKKEKKQNQSLNDSSVKEKININIDFEPKDNNILIISEKEQKAYLPFFYSQVKDIYENSKNMYPTLQSVVNDLYVLPLNHFKNSSIARFRESFRLIREKEKGSIANALDLGLELMFKYELNPIIIAACRNLDELDIYLDCLDENELYDFTCFEIKFEVMPKLLKPTKENTFFY